MMRELRQRRDHHGTNAGEESNFRRMEEQGLEQKQYEEWQRYDFIGLPTYYAAFVVIFLVTISGLVYLISEKLPTPLTFTDIGSHPKRFIEERARAHLHHLTSLGSKPTGSYENEVLAVEYIRKEILFTMQHSSGVQTIEFDLQKPTGSFYLDMKPGFISYYDNIQNVVVRLKGQKQHRPSALLINCHFDSVPTSPGGSDDILNCAVMLEVLRVLSASDVLLTHDIIFLFNGAEENILQASHGFISQHKWAKDVKAFINLEACGAGGRELLFQTVAKFPWLLKMYARTAPYPHASVLSEEVFQSGLIPSDTDFRIFRDFGNIPGLDFAHTKNGYVYHTKFDDEEQIPPGTLQHTGENLLALTRAVADSPEFGEKYDPSESAYIFFDVLGFFLVHYSLSTGTVLNFLVAFFSICTILGTVHCYARANYWVSAQELCLGTVCCTVGWSLAIFWTTGLAFSLDFYMSSMSWYSKPLIIVPLYVAPSVAVSSLGIILVKHMSKYKSVFRRGDQVRFLSLGVQFVWTLVLILGTLFGVRSTFLVAGQVFFPALAAFLSLWFFPPHSSLKGIFLFYFPSLIPTFVLVVYHAFMAFSTLVPIMGRIGSQFISEIIIAFIAMFFCSMCTSYLVPLLFLLRRPMSVIVSLAVIHLFMYVAIVSTSFGFPYSVSEPNSISPQRIYVWHVDREIYDTMGQVKHHDSGFWLVNVDRNSPYSFRIMIPEVTTAQPANTFCHSEVFCALPLYSPRQLHLLPHSLWIPASRPIVHEPTSVKMTSLENLNMLSKKVTFTITGPDHMSVMFSPKSHVDIVGWNLEARLIHSSTFNNRPAFFIYYGRGLEARPWNLTLDLLISKNDSVSLIDIGVAGHYVHDEKHFTSSFKDFLGRFPSWTYVTPWISTMKMWQF